MSNPKRYSEKIKREEDKKQPGLQMPSGTNASPFIKPLFAPLFTAHFQSHLESSPHIQAKLEISHPADDSEMQADAFADSFMQGDADHAQAILSHATSEISRMGEGVGMQTSDAFDQQLLHTKGQGQKLDEETKEELEQHTGTDLSGVNVHTDASADEMSESINAEAFAHGQDIYFKSGNYDPESAEGKELLAHEVAHTVQDGEELQTKIQRKLGDPDDYITVSVFVSDEAVALTDQVLINTYILSQAFGISEAQVESKMKGRLNFGWTVSPTLPGEEPTPWTKFDASDAGKYKLFSISRKMFELFADVSPQAKRDETGRLEGHEAGDALLAGFSKEYVHKINEQANLEYWKKTNDTKHKPISSKNSANAKLWIDERDKLLKKYEQIQNLPQKIKDFLFGGDKDPEPADFDKILQIAAILQKLSDEDLEILKRMSAGPTTDVDLVKYNLEQYVQCMPWVLRMRKSFDNSFVWNFDLSIVDAPVIDPAIDMTDEQAIFRILNLPVEKVELINAIYNAKYHSEDSGNMADDIDGEMDGDDWELARALLGRAGISLNGEETPAYIDTPMVNGSKGIYSQDPTKEVLQPGDDIWYGLNGHYESYEWGILYESGNVLIATDKSTAYQKATPEQTAVASNEFDVKWSDWKFPGRHTILCKVEDENGKIIYYAYPQEVRGDEQGISTIEVQYELIAHDIAYRNYLDKNTKIAKDLAGDDLVKAQKDYKGSVLSRALLTKWGYDDNVVEYNDEANTGFYAVLILPQKLRKDLNPIIAFRGTSDVKKDVPTDLDFEGPGWNQYNANKMKIQNLVATSNSQFPDKKIDLTGHSLGGALAQWTATDLDFAGKFERVITFQSPGINRERVKEYNAWDKDKKPSVVIHHVATGDIVPLAGEENIPGTYYKHTTQSHSTLFSHTHLMLESQAYETQRNKLGITDDVLTQLGWDDGNLPIERDMPVKSKTFPWQGERMYTEALRKEVIIMIDALVEMVKAIKETTVIVAESIKRAVQQQIIIMMQTLKIMMEEYRNATTAAEKAIYDWLKNEWDKLNVMKNTFIF